MKQFAQTFSVLAFATATLTSPAFAQKEASAEPDITDTPDPSATDSEGEEPNQGSEESAEAPKDPDAAEAPKDPDAAPTEGEVPETEETPEASKPISLEEAMQQVTAAKREWDAAPRSDAAAKEVIYKQKKKQLADVLKRTSTPSEPAPTALIDVRSKLSDALSVRCMTAICFGGHGREYGLEIVLDTPLSYGFSVGNSSLKTYMNSNQFGIDFNVGARFWIAYDILSFMVFFSKPIVSQDDSITLHGSDFPHPVTSIKRPYPSLGIGLLGDMLQVSASYDALINGDTKETTDPNFAPNARLSNALSITIGFAPFTALRTLAGTALSQDRKANEKK